MGSSYVDHPCCLTDDPRYKDVESSPIITDIKYHRGFEDMLHHGLSLLPRNATSEDILAWEEEASDFPGFPCIFICKMRSFIDHPLYLNDFSQGEEIVGIDAYMSVREPFLDKYEIPSEYSVARLEFSFVPNLHRANIKTIVQFFCFLNKEGLSLHSFEKSNIVFHRGQLKFCGLKFLQILEDADRAKNFRLLHDLINSLIRDYNSNNYEIPTSITNLLDMIKHYRRFEDFHRTRIEDILPNHLGILSHDTVLDYMRSFYEKQGFMRDSKEKKSYDTAVREMYIRKDGEKDWTQWFIRSYESYPDYRLGPVLDVFNYEENGRRATYNGVENLHLLKFCRHNAVHLSQHMKNHTGSAGFSSRDIELIIMVLFGEELLSFQMLTYRHAIDYHFIPDYLPSVSA